MPGPRSLLRLLALAAFILTVALALWLLEAEWPVVVVVMALAWVFAATFEWAAWRQERPGSLAATSERTASTEPGVPPPPIPEADLLTSPLLAAPEQVPAVTEMRPEEAEEEGPPAAPPPPSERPPLRPVPPPPSPAPSTTPPPAAARPARTPAPSGVVDLRTRATVQPRHWNLWDLERLAREELHGDPLRLEALSYLFVHLRQFATPDGSLPTEFDGLVRESFGDLLEQRR